MNINPINLDSLSPIILTLVTFIPAAGGLLILLIPRRDRDIRVFALVVSILAFVASLHLPVHLHRDPSQFKFEIDKVWIVNPNIHYHMGIDGLSAVSYTHLDVYKRQTTATTASWPI